MYRLILDLLQQDRHRQALDLSQWWLERQDTDEARYLHALCLLQNDQARRSLPLFRQSCPPGASPRHRLNHALALERAGQPDAAIDLLRQILRASPDYELAHYNLGRLYLHRKQAERAIDCYARLASVAPDNADYHCALADAHRQAHHWREAIDTYHHALERQPDHHASLFNLGTLLLLTGDSQQVLDLSTRAIESCPEDTAFLKMRGDGFLLAERYEAAMDCYADAHDLDPENAGLSAAIGQVWYETGDFSEARHWFTLAVQLDERLVQAHCGLAMLDREQGHFDQAIDRLTKQQHRSGDAPQILSCLADIHWDNGDLETALACLQTLVERQPEWAMIHVRMAAMHLSAGHHRAARLAYETALQLNPRNTAALAGLSQLLGEDTPEAIIERLRRQQVILERRSLAGVPSQPSALSHIHAALCRYHDRNADYELAVRHGQQANDCQWQALQQRKRHYCPEQHERFVTQMLETVPPVDSPDNPATGELIPVFIVSMPRSGTTLLEQMLASHDRVLGLGERPFAAQSHHLWQQGMPLCEIRQWYRQRLEGLVQHAGNPAIRLVIDKMPDNYCLLGWIRTLLPQAKIIHIQRQEADVALSCWLTSFSQIRWACKTGHIRHRIHQYRRMMDHWQQRLGDELLTVHYESLIASPQRHLTRCFHHLGLDNHLSGESLRKAHTSNPQLIRTASVTQVRHPLFTTAIGRWRHYAEWLPTLFER